MHGWRFSYTLYVQYSIVLYVHVMQFASFFDQLPLEPFFATLRKDLPMGILIAWRKQNANVILLNSIVMPQSARYICMDHRARKDKRQMWCNHATSSIPKRKVHSKSMFVILFLVFVDELSSLLR